MDAQQAGESVRGFAWLVSLAFAGVVGYLWAHRQRAAQVRSLQQRLDAVKDVATELLSERWRPRSAVDEVVRRHDLTLAPAILQARATARRAEAWLHEQQRGDAG